MNEAEFNAGYTFVLVGQTMEEMKDIEAAIKNYEKAIELGFDGNRPYDRLCVLYGKLKRPGDVERVLMMAIDVFENKVDPQRSDREPKLKKFKEKLEKLRAKG